MNVYGKDTHTDMKTKKKGSDFVNIPVVQKGLKQDGLHFGEG